MYISSAHAFTFSMPLEASRSSTNCLSKSSHKMHMLRSLRSADASARHEQCCADGDADQLLVLKSRAQLSRSLPPAKEKEKSFESRRRHPGSIVPFASLHTPTRLSLGTYPDQMNSVVWREIKSAKGIDIWARFILSLVVTS